MGEIINHNFKGVCSQISCSNRYTHTIEETLPLCEKMKLFCGEFKERYGKDKTHMVFLIPLCEEHHDRFLGLSY